MYHDMLYEYVNSLNFLKFKRKRTSTCFPSSDSRAPLIRSSMGARHEIRPCEIG